MVDVLVCYEYRLDIFYILSNLTKSSAKRALGLARVDKYRNVAYTHKSAVSP
jgi:hypothetical protein